MLPQEQTDDMQTGPVQPTGPPEYTGPMDDANGELPTEVKQLLQALAQKVSKREMWSRLSEIKQAAEQRFFDDGYQQIWWNGSLNGGAFQVGPGGYSGNNANAQGAKQPRLRKEYNIYRAYGRSFMAAFSQSPVGTRFEPDDPKDPRDTKAAPECDRMRRVIEKFNNPKELQVETASFLWTDNRVVAFTDYIVSAERYGVDDNGQPNGQEEIRLYGTLETKLPLLSKSTADMDYIKISEEFPMSMQKAKYPDKRKALSSGAKSYTDIEEVARNARIGSAEGQRWLAEDAIAHLATQDTYFFRPSIYYEYEDGDRELLQQYFPTGCRVVFTGSTLCESRDDTMDDHIAVLKPTTSRKGQGRISLGRSMVQIQTEFNDFMNLGSEYGKYGIPATFVDQNTIDIDAIQEQYSEPGSYHPVERQGQTPVSEAFYQETPVQFPPAVVAFMENLQGPLPQFVTGQMPSVFGGNMEDQKTAKAYSLSRDQALGLLSLNWYPFKQWYCVIIQQAVHAAANNREEGAVLSTTVGAGKDAEEVNISVATLRGNTTCTATTDESFPESYTAKKNTVMQVLQIGASDPVVGKFLESPRNLELFKRVIALPDLEIPGADSTEKQMQEIAEMLEAGGPAPDINAIDNEISQSVATTGQMPPMDAGTLPQTSTVPIDPDTDDHEVELATCLWWINSPEGQKAKKFNTGGYDNVRLHFLQHQAVLQQRALQAALQQQALAGPQAGSAPKEPGTPSAPRPQPQGTA